jgi:hypothetical protein
VNDPRRLIDEGSTGFESKLLRAGRKDAPAPHNRKRIAAALGVGSVFAASTVATGASATGKTWLGLATATAFRLTAGLTAGALAIYAGMRALSPEPKAPSAKPIVTETRRAPPSLPKEATAPVASAPPVEEVSEPVVRRPVASTAVDTLSEELAVLDQARRALAKRDYAGALASLDDYTRRFPKRRLSSEATVLRIETLVKSGDVPQATRIGKDFLASQPNGPYAKRVASLIGDSRAPTPGQ